LCGGPLNTACDPVNGIAALPWKPDCVAAAVGSVELVPHGRVVEVCGDEVRPLYYHEYNTEIPSGARSPTDVRREDGEPFETVAFFGLTSFGLLYAVGIDGIYLIKADGTAIIRPLQYLNFEDIGGVGVCYCMLGSYAVLTQVDQRRSMSRAPLLLVQLAR
jgi:hypothetical protein